MTIRQDPTNNEINTLLELINLDGKVALEVGCGSGRLTRRYGHIPAQVTAIDPFADGIQQANQNLPDALRDHVEFRAATFHDFAADSPSAVYDVVILSWSL